ncbi:MAG: hypothetical protein U9Q83_07900 [Bacteroidota bacterium]|nr:hypothetical protein [Bacteroidota bacterium]
MKKNTNKLITLLLIYDNLVCERSGVLKFGYCYQKLENNYQTLS